MISKTLHAGRPDEVLAASLASRSKRSRSRRPASVFGTMRAGFELVDSTSLFAFEAGVSTSRATKWRARDVPLCLFTCRLRYFTDCDESRLGLEPELSEDRPC